MDIGSALVRMYGDFLFKTPTNNLARALALERGPPIFFYHFTHQVFCNFSSLALSLSQNFNHQGALSLYDCLHLPPFQFLFKLFGLRFWFDWLWANTPLDWICRCPSLFCYDNVSYNSRSNDGVCHADELFMLFKAHQVPITMVRNETDKRVRNPRSKSRQFNSFR